MYGCEVSVSRVYMGAKGKLVPVERLLVNEPKRAFSRDRPYLSRSARPGHGARAMVQRVAQDVSYTSCGVMEREIEACVGPRVRVSLENRARRDQCATLAHMTLID